MTRKFQIYWYIDANASCIISDDFDVKKTRRGTVYLVHVVWYTVNGNNRSACVIDKYSFFK